MAVSENIPQLKNLSWLTNNALQTKLVPLNMDGSVQDLTGFTDPVLTAMPDSSGISIGADANGTVVLADATGMTASFPSSEMFNVGQVIGLTRGWYQISCTTPSGTASLSYGNIQGAVGPSP